MEGLNEPSGRVYQNESKTPFYKKTGCWLTCLIVIIAFLVLATVGGYFVYKKVNEVVGDFKDEFIAEGYEFRSGQSMKIDEDMVGDYLYLCQTLELNGDVEGNLAVIAQQVKINSAISGSVNVKAQSLMITENAHISGGLNIFCQLAEIRGVVGGQITGSAQVLNVSEALRDRVDVDIQAIDYLGSDSLQMDADTIRQTLDDSTNISRQDTSSIIR